MENVEVDIDKVKIVVYFEVIEIFEDIDPYPVLLGINWLFDDNFIRNLKQW